MRLTCLPRIAFVLRSDWFFRSRLVYAVDAIVLALTFLRIALLACRLLVLENIVQTIYTVYSEPFIPQGFSFY